MSEYQVPRLPGQEDPQGMYAAIPSQQGGSELNSLADLVDKKAAPRVKPQITKEQEEYFERLAREAQAGAAAPPTALVKMDRATKEVVGRAPTADQKAALAQKAMQSRGPTDEDRRKLAEAALSDGQRGGGSSQGKASSGSTRSAPTAEDRAKLAEMAKQNTLSSKPAAGGKSAPSAEERAALAAQAMASSSRTSTMTSQSGKSAPTAEQRAQLAAMAMQGSGPSRAGAPSAEDRARLAAMAMQRHNIDDDELEEVDGEEDKN